MSGQAPVVVPFARSPQTRRREYADAGTQYTPPGYPPTYHPSSTAANTESLEEAGKLSLDSPRKGAKRRETSAEPPITDPPEPELRIDPQPVVTIRDAQPTTATSADAGGGHVVEQSPKQDETSERSAAKRPRPQDPDVKIMPLKYETCDVKDLGVLISDMLMELIRLNDDIPLQDRKLTRFHSR